MPSPTPPQLVLLAHSPFSAPLPRTSFAPSSQSHSFDLRHGPTSAAFPDLIPLSSTPYSLSVLPQRQQEPQPSVPAPTPLQHPQSFALNPLEDTYLALEGAREMLVEQQERKENKEYYGLGAESRLHRV
ncbi:hypothetical protein JCM11251_007958 [Rhodosporidiobolus azoricus]